MASAHAGGDQGGIFLLQGHAHSRHDIFLKFTDNNFLSFRTHKSIYKESQLPGATLFNFDRHYKIEFFTLRVYPFTVVQG